MNTAVDTPTIINTPFAGGFYSGRIMLPAGPRAVITAPKADGEFQAILNKSLKRVDGALSYCDGLANTRALAEAGSKIAAQVLALTIGGFSDWQIPARDALEVMYRAHKPTARKNECYFRDGDNPSSVPVGYPYTKDVPAQAAEEIFREGGAEAFEPEYYWASTPFEADDACAWFQDFSYGGQDYDRKDRKFWVRAVRLIQS